MKKGDTTKPFQFNICRFGCSRSGSGVLHGIWLCLSCTMVCPETSQRILGSHSGMGEPPSPLGEAFRRLGVHWAGERIPACVACIVSTTLPLCVHHEVPQAGIEKGSGQRGSESDTRDQSPIESTAFRRWRSSQGEITLSTALLIPLVIQLVFLIPKYLLGYFRPTSWDWAS